MPTARQEVQQILDSLDDSASFEDIQYHIFVRQQVERGLNDLDEGRVLSHDEVRQRMARWRTARPDTS